MKNEYDQKFEAKQNKLQEELEKAREDADVECRDALYTRLLAEKRRSKKVTLGEAATHLEAIASAFEKERFSAGGPLSVTAEEPDHGVRLAICEADVFDSLLRILDELFIRGIEDENCPDAFGLLQDHFDKHQLPYGEKRRIGNAYLAFRARLGEIPMSWVPGSPEYKDKEDRA